MISICIATHNSSATIRRTLYSIRTQIYGDFEVIIVDDNSTDDTYDIIKNEFCSQDTRFKLYKVKSDAVPFVDAHNMSYQLARGEYLCRIDHDDILFNDYLLTHKEFLDEHPNIDAHCCGIRMIYLDENLQIPEYIEITSELHHSSTCLEDIALFNKYPSYAYNYLWQRENRYYPWHNNTSALRKTFYDKYHPKFVAQEIGDLLFWRQVMAYGGKCYISPEEHILVEIVPVERHPVYDRDIKNDAFIQYVAAKFAYEGALCYNDDVVFDKNDNKTAKNIKDIFYNTVHIFKDKLIEEGKWEGLSEEFKKLNSRHGYKDI